ncbi:thiaminase II [Demetria terragena]|uniref:thiaminase II n=1 Tax=Demetria terragena TaxID=63959 RepID=UPI0003603D9B|nr:thiaminase II [Demetria terragena]
MGLFAELRDACAPTWQAYVDHEFVRCLGDGSLPEGAFKDYLVQDYLFLIQFARAYALSGYKAQSVDDLRGAHEALGAILNELPLHERLCARWDLTPDELAMAEEKSATVAYTRFVLDVGMSGDLLDLNVALAPCVIGYAEIGQALAPRLAANPEHRFGEWIAEYAGEAYQHSADVATARLDDLMDQPLSSSRRSQLERTFATATRCEAQFWQSALA